MQSVSAVECLFTFATTLVVQTFHHYRLIIVVKLINTLMNNSTRQWRFSDVCRVEFVIFPSNGGIHLQRAQ